MKNFRKVLKSRTKRDLPTFSVNVKFKQHDNKLNVDNKYDCNAKSLKLCDMNDATTLFGCKELTVRCHHFDKDSKFVENNKTTIIPKNKTPNEGYALAISSIAESCNPYHGDLVLVAKEKTSTDYMLVCWCKYPGYIGNDNLLGNCTQVYICNGKIDDINKPLNDINCVCPLTEISVKYSINENSLKLPVCKPLLVHEANKLYTDWSHIVPWSSDRVISSNVYVKDIRKNLNTSILLNPCNNSLLNMKEPIENGFYNDFTKTCCTKDYGIPVRIGILEKKDSENVSPWNMKPVNPIDSVLPTSSYYKSIRILDRIGGKRKLGSILTSVDFIKTKNKRLRIALPEDISFCESCQIYLTTRKFIQAGCCRGEWPSYTCIMKNYFQTMVNGIPIPGYRDPPGTFLWNTEKWIQSESLVKKGLEPNNTGLELNNKYLDTFDYLKYCGVEFSTSHEAYDPNSNSNGIVAFNNEDDYKKHHNVLTFE